MRVQAVRRSWAPLSMGLLAVFGGSSAAEGAPAHGQMPGEQTRAQAEQHLRQRLADILRAPELATTDVGVHVRALGDGHTVFERNASKLFNPASNVKLVTTAAALWYLGPSYRFKTVAYRDRNLAGGVLAGNLYIRGFGDPTLTDERLFGFVNEIALHGIHEVKGDLVIDDSFFDQVFEGPGWEQEWGDKSYAAPMGALSVNYGTFSVRVLPGDSVGAEAKVMVWPDLPSIEVVNEAVTRGDDTRSRIWIGTSKADNNRLEVTVRGAIGIDNTVGEADYRRVTHPTSFAAEHMKRMLEMRGVKIKGRVRVGPLNRAGVPVAVHYSSPLAEITSTLNKYSNNFIAEQILKTLGAEIRGEPGTWAKGCSVLSDFLREIGVPPDAFVLGNGSGLNDVNRFTPEHLTKILEAMYRRFELGPEYVASLGVAGSSGTITSRFANAPAASRLRAKTGSLFGVSALSGYVVTKDNQVMAFSVMMNGYTGRARQMWAVQDQIGNALAEYQGGEIIAQP